VITALNIISEGIKRTGWSKWLNFWS
jgi:hypothetical protein